MRRTLRSSPSPMRIAAIAAIAAISILAPAARGADPATIRVFPKEEGPRVDPFVYGHFLEHIYHSVVDGLDGQAIRNRSFEEVPGGIGTWSRDGDAIVQESPATDIHTEFGDPTWTDYELTLEARKDGGAEGFLILVRAADRDNFYWWNIGGWGNRSHALERERGGARGVITRQVEGRIETGRWYRIRVRVEGDRIEGFLDGEKLLDARDGTHRRGAVGLGTWATRARFRNVRIASLDGKVLFEGLPEIAKPPAIALAWSAWGEGASYSIDGEKPFNSKQSQRIDLDGGPGGIAQDRIALVAGETYRGSLYIRAADFEGEGALRVQDPGGAEILRRSFASGEIGRDWRRVPIEFRSGVTASDATLILVFSGKGTLWIDQVTMRSDATIRTGGFRPDLLEAVRALRPPVIRWPGGCFAEYYHWRTGIGPQEARESFANIIWGEMDDAGFGTDEFLRLCRTVGAEPLVVINLGTHDDPSKTDAYLAEALEWIEYMNGSAETAMGRLRLRNGHPDPYGVRHIELDNETWHMGVERYAERVKRFAPEIRKRWPEITIYACGSAGYGRGGLDWNRRLLDLAAEHFDVLSIHHYESPDRFAEGPRDYEAFWRRTADLVARSRNPKVRIAVTEWNAQSTDWRTGLYAGGFLAAAERQAGAVAMASPALFLRRVDAPAWDNAFINHDHTRWFPAPNYVVMRLFREHFAPQVVRSDAPDDLSVVAAIDADGKLVVKVVHAGSRIRAARIAIEGAKPAGDPRAWVVAAGLRDRNTLEAPNKIAPHPARARVESGAIEVELPPYAVAVVEVDLTR
ncbi:MAG: DUF1080 domain-containing protein [Planctomycetes bacterium]|nr:DUF1080 domain-containing protein [Planctomycetota bacterium]